MKRRGSRADWQWRVPGSDPARWSLTHSATGLGHGVLPDDRNRAALRRVGVDAADGLDEIGGAGPRQMRTVGYGGFKKTAEWIATWGDPEFARPKTQLPTVPQIQRYFEESDWDSDNQKH